MRINMPITQNEYVLAEGETIVSRTDLKGKIVYVNRDFIVASGFVESELIGQPHNILRHPDMPPAAFEDMWNTLKAGLPWSGMVKNRRKNGDYYWVVANATPVKEGDQIVGYMSVRTRPAREQVEAAEALYRKMRNGEAKGIVLRGGRILKSGLGTTSDSLGNLIDRLGIGGKASVLGLGLLGSGALGGLAAQQGAMPLAAVAGACALLCIGGGVRFARRISGTLGFASAQLEAYGQGKFDGIIDVSGVDQLSQTMLALKRVQTRLGFEFSDARKTAAEASRVRQALDEAATPVFIADSDGSLIYVNKALEQIADRKSTRLNSSHSQQSRMPSSA